MLIQTILVINNSITLTYAANIVSRYIKSEENEITLELANNLDRGAQDVFGAYSTNGLTINDPIFGSRNFSEANNLHCLLFRLTT